MRKVPRRPLSGVRPSSGRSNVPPSGTQEHNVASLHSILGLACLALVFASPVLAGEPGISSPNGEVQLRLQFTKGPLQYAVFFHNKPVIELSPMSLTIDGVEL